MSDRDTKLPQTKSGDLELQTGTVDKGSPCMEGKQGSLLYAFQDSKYIKNNPEKGPCSKNVPLPINVHKIDYKKLFRNFPSPSFLTTTERLVIDCSRSMAKTLGYGRDELQMKPLEELIQDSSQQKRIFEILRHDHPAADLEVVFTRRNGMPFFSRLNLTPLSIEGESLFLCVFHETSKENEERVKLLKNNKILETIFENSHMQIAYVNKELEYVRVNKPYADFYGLRTKDMVGKNYFYFPHDRGSNDIFCNVLKTGEPYFASAQAFDPSDLSTDCVTFWDWSVVPIQDEQEAQSGLILMFKDVTERLRAKNELIKSREQLFQAQKMEALGVLVAGVAHEINNPVNQVIFNTPLLQGIWEDIEPVLEKHSLNFPKRKYCGLSFEFLKENMTQLLSNMDMAANRIARIVEDLKNFSRRSSVTDKHEIHLNTAVNNAIRLAQTTIKKSGVELHVDLGEDLPPMEGSLHNLEQIVLNLIINATQAMEDATGEVHIKTFCREERLFLLIEDNGKGIHNSIANRIFDPFVTNRQDEGGTGLGLSVTYNLVKAHNGNIYFESKENKGTIFTLNFPYI